MATLKKPDQCPQCFSTDLMHQLPWGPPHNRPEAWVCPQEHLAAVRPQRLGGKCRVCGKTPDETPFKKGKNLCMQCNRDYMNQWKKENAEHLKEYRSQPGFRLKRQAAVRAALQRSPEAFIRGLWHGLTKQARFMGSARAQQYTKDGIKRRFRRPLEVTITFDYVMGLWAAQSGRCAITNLPMSHRFGETTTISIDRVDSTKGYVLGNVQLVCQAANLMKNNRTTEQAQKFILMAAKAIEEAYKTEVWKTRNDVIKSLRETEMFTDEWILERFGG